MPGLGPLPGSSCSHSDGKAQRRPTYQRLVSSGELSDGYGVLAWLAVIHVNIEEPAQSGEMAGTKLKTSANELRRMFTALCGPPHYELHADGDDGSAITRNAPATATTSDNAIKITKCGWSIAPERAP